MTSKNYKTVHNNNNNNHNNSNSSKLHRKSSFNNRSPSSRKHQYSDSVDENTLSRTSSPPTYMILKRQQSVSDSEKTTTSFTSTSLSSTSTKIKNGHRHSSSTPSSSSSSKERRSKSDVSSSSSNNKNSKHHNHQQESLLSFKTDSSDESDVNSMSNTHLKLVSPVISNNNNIHHNNPLSRHQASISSLNTVLEEANKADNDNSLRNPIKHVRSKSSHDKSSTKESRRPHSDYYPSTTVQESNKITVSHFSDNDEYHSRPSKSYSRRPSFSGSPSRFDSSKLYAGPTFNNSPDPSELPIPSFLGSKSLTKDSALPQLQLTNNNNNPSYATTTTRNDNNRRVIKHSPQASIDSGFSSGNTSEDDIFIMDDVFSNQYKPKNHSSSNSNLLEKEASVSSFSKRQEHQTSAAAYMIPERMATSHHPSQVYSVVDELSLDDISKALKSILKISGQ